MSQAESFQRHGLFVLSMRELTKALDVSESKQRYSAKCRGTRRKIFQRYLDSTLDPWPSKLDTQVESEVRMEKQTKQEQAKRRVHITWNEAQRAETERENVRRARYKSIPSPNLLKVIAANVFRELPKLKATALRLLSVKNH